MKWAPRLARIVGAVVIFALGTVAVCWWQLGRMGSNAYGVDQFDKSAKHYHLGSSSMVFERWKALFGEGTAILADGQAARAETVLVEVLEMAPAAKQCTVRDNLSLAQELQGDAAAESDNATTAAAFWEAALVSLRDGSCPETDEIAAEAEQRLEDKLDRVRDKPQPSPTPSPTPNPTESPQPSPPPTDSPVDERIDELRQRNRIKQNEYRDSNRTAGGSEIWLGRRW
jgi:hypothetical protein